MVVGFLCHSGFSREKEPGIVYVCVYACVCVYIYIYRERESESNREREKHTHTELFQGIDLSDYGGSWQV